MPPTPPSTSPQPRFDAPAASAGAEAVDGAGASAGPPPRGGLAAAVMERLLPIAASGVVPARWVEPRLPPPSARTARTGRLRLEIVSHCWRYAHLLAHQLGSLVRFPPREVDVRMTVYHAAEDAGTVALLAAVGEHDVPGVTWDWRTLPRRSLMRRAIGRDHAARVTEADWVWFTDCDVLFREDCLDRLAAAVQGRRDALIFPRVEQVTPLLPDDHPMVGAAGTGGGGGEGGDGGEGGEGGEEAGEGERTGAGAAAGPALPEDVDPGLFAPRERDRATGPLQITHGDVARAVGYCHALAHYQRPAATWQKAREDRAFRWLLRTQGTPVDVPGVHRIRHAAKGRYRGGVWSTSRGAVRQMQERLGGGGGASSGSTGRGAGGEDGGEARRGVNRR